MKTQAIKPAMQAIFGVIAEKQFREMEVMRPYYDKMLDNIPSGKETQSFKVGQSVSSLGTGTYKKGLIMEVVDVYEENGYWKYICGHGKVNKKTGKFQFNCTERQKDLGAA
jgi:hypothetical protein